MSQESVKCIGIWNIWEIVRLLDSQMKYIPGGTVRIDFIRIFRFSGVVDFSKSAWSFSKFLDMDCKTSIGTEYELSSDSVISLLSFLTWIFVGSSFLLVDGGGGSGSALKMRTKIFFKWVFKFEIILKKEHKMALLKIQV